MPPDSACGQQASPTVYALLILAHESYHTAGVIVEVTANCYAIQAIAFVASRLGTTDREGELRGTRDGRPRAVSSQRPRND